jgi:hypothetical protein
MDIETALVTYLKAHTGLKALIGAKLYPEEIPQGTVLPAVSYIKISDVKDHTLTGQLENERPIFQFTAFSLTKAQARLVANQLKLAMKDYVGTLSGIEIQKIELQNELTNLDTTADGTVKVYSEDLEFEVNYVN